MSKRDQLNNMSKKEILQALAYQQNQDMAAMNRFLIALAQAAGIKPEEFAKYFMSQDANREYAEKLNAAIDAQAQAAQSKEAPADGAAQEEPA
jgi:protein-disulfide isomerase-like protein with CxxC motif